MPDERPHQLRGHRIAALPCASNRESITAMSVFGIGQFRWPIMSGQPVHGGSTLRRHSGLAGIVMLFPALGMLALLASIYGLYLLYLGMALPRSQG